MRRVGIAFLLVFMSTTAAVAQEPAAQASAEVPKTFASSADVAALIAKAKSERKDGQAIVFARILQLAPYTAGLEYRASVGNASVHEQDAELFYVIDGAATLVIGGKLVNQVRTSPTNLTGSAIEGGTSQAVAKGDFVIIPENTPHWFSAINGTIVLMSMHVPRSVVAKQ